MFTELLPREESWRGTCEYCEREVERREGPKAPRHYQFVARGIAEALGAVGASATYMHASHVARDRARRFRCDAKTGELRESDHGQLLADWVELFAPVVFAPHAPSAWPAAGSLLLNHLPFRVRALDEGGKTDPRRPGRLRCLLRGRLLRGQAEALARGGLFERASGQLERVPRLAAGAAAAHRLRRPRRPAAGDRGARAAGRAAALRMAPAACARASARQKGER